VGIADVVPKLVARRLLEPALKLNEPVQLVCREEKMDRLITELAAHEIDVLLTDSPISQSGSVRAFNHLLGECDVTFMATAPIARAHRRRFPQSLAGAPMLLPSESTVLRRTLEQWFAKVDVRPNVVAVFDDSALLKVFGQTGQGIFPVPTVIANEVRRQYKVVTVGRTAEVRERFYAVSVERRLKHPAVVAISEEARQRMFS
jgi:LysR family transcriptional activator of nhaA